MVSRKVSRLTAGPDYAQNPVTRLSGVGLKLAERLKLLGLERIQDLWFHLPLRYDDKTRLTAIADLCAGGRAQVLGTVVGVERIFRSRPQLKVCIQDNAGHILYLRFFHFHRNQFDRLKSGGRLLCFGEVRFGADGPTMVHPHYQCLVGDNPPVMQQRLSPIYPSTEGVHQKRLADLITKALKLLPDASDLELIPSSLCAAHDLSSLRDALLYVHHPPPDVSLQTLAYGRHAAQKRLIFEELLAHHLSLKCLRTAARTKQALPLLGDGRLRHAMLTALNFSLTSAQQRVTQEVLADLARSKPMLRLIQGDVGSGKTVVAAFAALAAIESAQQVALVAPTELLAEQHLRNFRHWFEPLGIEVAWLSSKVSGKQCQHVLQRVGQGNAAILIGTHALMQEGVTFAQLGLVIVDEQHRFGVQQRFSLRDKGGAGSNSHVAHQLMLTATPIPRTLAMSVYADLDVSSIDELPPGRTPVKTLVMSNVRRDEVMTRIRAACVKGGQAYWVCTLIEESEQLCAQAAEVIHAELCTRMTDVRVGLLHGRMRAKQKQETMDAFKAGDLDVLVATTVIEVGVDVPNASLMVIENSDRLGLAQLHQLRGRVGRGSIASSCVLLYQHPLGKIARERLDVMRQTSDGFRIAEKDLALRGPGEVLGTKQTGQVTFRIADLDRDAYLLPDVQDVAAQMLSNHMSQVEKLLTRWVGDAIRYVDI